MARLQREDGKSLYFEDYAGEGRPIVMAHGWGASTRVWDTTTAFLHDRGHRVVCFDQRGCGQSDKDFATVTIAKGGDDVVALVETLGLDGVVLNGWSLGGAIMVDAASKLGDRCAGVILTGGATPRYTQAEDFPHGNEPGSTAGVIALLRASRPAFLHGLTQAVCVKEQPPGVLDWMYSIFMQTSPMADATLAELDDLDQRAILSALSVPVLSIIGEADAFVAPAIGKVAGEMAPKGKAISYPGVGHAPFLEESERYCADIAAFIDSL